MKVVYIAKAQIPSTSANSVHVMKISEAFHELCSDFSLLVPAAQEKDSDGTCFEFYGVKPFDIRYLFFGGHAAKGRYEFAVSAVREACRLQAQAVVTRDPLTAFLAVLAGKETVLDLHGDLRHLCGRAYRMIKWKWFTENKHFHPVMITDGLRRFYQQTYHMAEEKMTVLPDGYTAGDYEGLSETEPLKEKKLKIGYCGSFLQGKGLDIVLKTAQKDTQNEYHLYGGTKEQAAGVSGIQIPDNVFCHGHIPNAQVPAALCAQDILLLPNQDKLMCKGEDIGKVTSPLKMFEYMASARVIIASDLPVLREILNEDNSYFAAADDVEQWCRAVNYISEHREEACLKAQRAQNDVKQYTWKNRALRMLKLTGMDIEKEE